MVMTLASNKETIKKPNFLTTLPRVPPEQQDVHASGITLLMVNPNWILRLEQQLDGIAHQLLLQLSFYAFTYQQPLHACVRAKCYNN